jgi:hypothetical protein
MSRIASYTENDLAMFRSKIRELHPVQRASLGALLRHLLRVSSHSDKNAMTVKALATRFSYSVFRGDADAVSQGLKVRCNFFLELYPTDYLGGASFGGSHPTRTCLV